MMHWTLLIAIIIQIESGGNLLARGKHGELGPMQAKPIVVRDVNRIYGTKFTYADRTNLEKSKEMFRLYTTYWMRKLRLPETDENAARIWKEGPNNYANERATEYANKVASVMRIEWAKEPAVFKIRNPDEIYFNPPK